MKGLGKHLLIELFDCDHHSLDDLGFVKVAILDAAQQSNATVVETALHEFSPLGVSGVVIIAESHISIHTWPEHGYAALDVFTCSDKLDPYEIMETLVKRFAARSWQSTLVHRGGLLELEASEAVQM